MNFVRRRSRCDYVVFKNTIIVKVFVLYQELAAVVGKAFLFSQSCFLARARSGLGPSEPAKDMKSSGSILYPFVATCFTSFNSAVALIRKPKIMDLSL